MTGHLRTSAAGACARCSTSWGRRSSSSASCSPRGRTWCRPTSWPSSGPPGRRAPRAVRSDPAGRGGRARAHDRAGLPGVRRDPSRPRRSGRSTTARLPGGSAGGGRGPAPGRRAPALNADIQLLYQVASRRRRDRVRRLQFIDLVETGPRVCPGRSGASWTTASRPATPSYSGCDLAGDWTRWRCRGSTGGTAIVPGAHDGSGRGDRAAASSTSGMWSPDDRKRPSGTGSPRRGCRWVVHGLFDADPHPANILVRGPDQYQPWFTSG